MVHKILCAAVAYDVFHILGFLLYGEVFQGTEDCLLVTTDSLLARDWYASRK